MSAFQYPEQYGPRSPAFSRAIVKRWEHNRHLYISGTASITDHRSRHVGDSLGQLNETMANLEALVAAADKADSVVFSLTDRSVLKVYVRHGQDEAEIRRWLRDVMGFRASIIILRGDICRRELLVEIEGILAA